MPIRKMHQNLHQHAGHLHHHHFGRKHHHHHTHTKSLGFGIINGYKREFTRFMNKMAPNDATKAKMAGLAILGAVVVGSGMVVKGLMNVFKTNNFHFNKDLTKEKNLEALHEKLDNADFKISFLGARTLKLSGKDTLLKEIKVEVERAKLKLQETKEYYEMENNGKRVFSSRAELLDQIETRLQNISDDMDRSAGPITRAMAHIRS